MQKSFFAAWLPKPLIPLLMLVLLLPLLMLGGLYTPSIPDMVGGLGALSEYFLLATYFATIGTVVAFTLVIRVLMWQPPKTILLFSFGGLLAVHLACASTTSPTLIVALNLLSGMFKIVGMLVLVLPMMRILSPDGDRARFYAMFYPITLSAGQAAGVLTSYLAYTYNWQAVYAWMVPVLLVCLLLCLLCFNYERMLPYTSFRGIDWLGFFQLTAALMLLCYVCAFGKVEDWFASPRIQGASIAGGLLGLWFVRRQLYLANPLVNLRLLRRRNVYLGCLLFLLVGIFLASSSLQSLFTSGILRFDAQTNARLNLWMIPGIVLGSVYCFWWFKRQRGFKGLFLLGFGAYTVAHALLYFLVAPGTGYLDLVLPTVLRGVGMALLFIVGGLFLTDKLDQADMIATSFFMTLTRSLLCVVVFSTLYANWSYRAQVDNTTQLAAHMDALDPQLLARMQPAMRGAAARGLDTQTAGQQALYGLVVPQAILLTVRQLLGYVVWAGAGVLVLVLGLRMRPLNRRRLVAWRRRWRGQPVVSLEGL
jgi:DHA2 family multidrug resistance protein